MEPRIPEGRALVRADRWVGEGEHYAHADLALLPAAATAEDERGLEALRRSMTEAKARWDQFDVELDIAVELEARIAAVTLLRDARDRELLAAARLLQGAAVANAFSPGGFAEAEEAVSFRSDLAGVRLVRPWVMARALEPERVYDPSAVMGSALYERFEASMKRIDSLPRGGLDLTGVPVGAQVWVDGEPLQGVQAQVSLAAGQHYVHVVRDGQISGRSVLEVQPGLSTALPLSVSDVQLEDAHHLVMDGNTAGLSSSVKGGLEALMAAHDGPVFVAAEEDGKVVVLPFARGAQLLRAKPLTLVSVGEMGAGVVASDIFDDSDGVAVAPGAHGGLGVELGIYQLALAGGMDVAFTPGQTVSHANGALTDNVTMSVLPQPWGGVGAYVLRPTGDRATLVALATLGWSYPAFISYGGRVSLGIPMEGEDTWFRITAGATAADKATAEWRDDPSGAYTDVSMRNLFVRVGLETRIF
ncbi:MAG: hypothetical protein JXX28_05020 [Deltaproteobacteria bacterium]|nr:hypothetical protein [Deltaproteobacteria bacterium]